MTENMAGRGLAGLADRISERVAALLDPEQLATLGKGGRVPSSTLRYNVRKAKLGVAEIVKGEIAALEAAAPPSTARDEEWMEALAAFCNEGGDPWVDPPETPDECERRFVPELTDKLTRLAANDEAQQAYWLWKVSHEDFGANQQKRIAALATPSPRAPTCICGASSIFPKISCPVHGLQEPAGSGADCFYCHNAHVMGHECTCVCHGSPRKVGEDGASKCE